MKKEAEGLGEVKKEAKGLGGRAGLKGKKQLMKAGRWRTGKGERKCAVS